MKQINNHTELPWVADMEDLSLSKAGKPDEIILDTWTKDDLLFVDIACNNFYKMKEALELAQKTNMYHKHCKECEYDDYSECDNCQKAVFNKISDILKELEK